MSLSLLDKLTIVIYTYNRHKYLKRTINYWSNYNVKLLILDGSTTKFEDLCLKTKNIKYVYDDTGLYKRLLSSINYIDTEFVILGSDDEFYLPSALSSSIEFLCKESSYSSCGGYALGFHTKGKLILGTKQYPFEDFCLNHNSACDRIFNHFSNYMPAHFYSVMSFNKWKIICSYVFGKKYYFSGAHELQVEFLCAISGKSKIIPELLWMRNKEVPTESYEILKLPLGKWWLDKKYQYEKLSFLKRMKEACDKLTFDQNFILKEDAIIRSFEMLINKYKVKSKILIRIKSILPDQIQEVLKFILSYWNNLQYRILEWYKIKTNKYNTLLYEANKLEEQGVSVNHKELNKIISSLNNFKNID